MEASLPVIGLTILVIVISILAYTQLSGGKSSSGESSKQKKSENKQKETEKEVYFGSVEDDGIEEGKTVKVTSKSKKLDTEWTAAELGPNDDKDMYLGCIGKITEVEEDDDTVQLRWANYDTCWIPVKACMVCTL